MKKNTTYWAMCLIALSALQACSDKTVTAPAVLVPAPAAAPAPAVTPEPAAEQASAPAKPLAKTATLQCEERKVVLEASCLDLYGPSALACTSQRLTVSDSATGKPLKVREFTPEKAEGDDPATVADQFADISCVRTKSDEKYIVATMGNGGNCDECEWVDVYSWDGVLLGSEGGKRKKIKEVSAAVKAANDAQVPAIGKTDLPGFYSAVAE